MIIIHGENTTNSRKKLDEIVSNRQNVKWLDGKKISLDDVKHLFATTELFAQEKNVVIENCKGISKNVLEVLVKETKDKNTTVNIIFWQDGNYDARLIKKFNNAQVFSFPLPKYYFEFLDSLSPQNGKVMHTVYKKLLDSFVPEQIFFSLIKRTRQLLILKNTNYDNLEEFVKMNPWQKNKLLTQASRWDKDELERFYLKLYKTEKKLKSSEIPTNLEKHIDILLLTELH